jgi:hypothetical protein
MSNISVSTLEETIVLDGDTEEDYLRRRKLAQRIVAYSQELAFALDFEDDNWNYFELSFLYTMDDMLETYGDAYMISEKQETILERIIEKYDIP